MLAESSEILRMQVTGGLSCAVGVVDLVVQIDMGVLLSVWAPRGLSCGVLTGCRETRLLTKHTILHSAVTPMQAAESHVWG